MCSSRESDKPGWRDISVSKKDKLTDETAKEIAGNNGSWSQWCGVRPETKPTS